jgi:hypothetical protein
MTEWQNGKAFPAGAARPFAQGQNLAEHLSVA